MFNLRFFVNVTLWDELAVQEMAGHYQTCDINQYAKRSRYSDRFTTHSGLSYTGATVPEADTVTRNDETKHRRLSLVWR